MTVLLQGLEGTEVIIDDILIYESVGSVNFCIIPSRSIRRSSSLTFGKSGNGKRLAVVKQYSFKRVDEAIIFGSYSLVKCNPMKVTLKDDQIHRLI
jgi:hypothetical protein